MQACLIVFVSPVGEEPAWVFQSDWNPRPAQHVSSRASCLVVILRIKTQLLLSLLSRSRLLWRRVLHQFRCKCCGEALRRVLVHGARENQMDPWCNQILIRTFAFVASAAGHDLLLLDCRAFTPSCSTTFGGITISVLLGTFHFYAEPIFWVPYSLCVEL